MIKTNVMVGMVYGLKLHSIQSLNLKNRSDVPKKSLKWRVRQKLIDY